MIPNDNHHDISPNDYAFLIPDNNSCAPTKSIIVSNEPDLTRPNGLLIHGLWLLATSLHLLIFLSPLLLSLSSSSLCLLCFLVYLLLLLTTTLASTPTPQLRVVRAFRSILEDLEDKRSTQSVHCLRTSRSHPVMGQINRLSSNEAVYIDDTETTTNNNSSSNKKPLAHDNLNASHNNMIMLV